MEDENVISRIDDCSWPVFVDNPIKSLVVWPIDSDVSGCSVEFLACHAKLRGGPPSKVNLQGRARCAVTNATKGALQSQFSPSCCL